MGDLGTNLEPEANDVSAPEQKVVRTRTRREISGGLWYYRARCISVYDGDTIDLQVDLGFAIHFTITARLYGIDTPEIRGDERPSGLVSRDRVVELVEDKEVFLETIKDSTGKFGRYLAIIWIESPDDPDIMINVNDLLLKEGLAEEYII